MLFNLGMTYLYASREYEVAAQFLQRSIRHSHWKDSIAAKSVRPVDYGTRMPAGLGGERSRRERGRAQTLSR